MTCYGAALVPLIYSHYGLFGACPFLKKTFAMHNVLMNTVTILQDACVVMPPSLRGGRLFKRLFCRRGVSRVIFPLLFFFKVVGFVTASRESQGKMSFVGTANSTFFLHLCRYLLFV